MGSLPWGDLKEAHPYAFEHASNIFSLAGMNYQVCNGGIEQYFGNTYNEARKPYHEHDVERYDLDAQKEYFAYLVRFAKDVYPERVAENAALEAACSAFRELWLEKDAENWEDIVCEEDEYIIDDDGDEIPNPDYFEEYEEMVGQEDVLHGDTGFDDLYYKANDYLEELLELQSQLCCKQLVLEVSKDMNHEEDLMCKLRAVLPESAFPKRSLSEQIQSAAARQVGVLNEGRDQLKGIDITPSESRQ